MFTRVVELRTKTGKTKELSTTMNEKVVPILRKQPGFIDEITLISTLDPERILALSFWQDEADATRYNTEQYPTITDMLGSLLETTPTVQTFNVDLSTTHDISKVRPRRPLPRERRASTHRLARGISKIRSTEFRHGARQYGQFSRLS